MPEIARSVAVSPDWIRLAAAYLGLGSLSYPYEFRTRDSDVVVLEDICDLVTVWIIYCRNEYTVRPDDAVIIDAGANIGVFTLYAARRAPAARIVSVEPFPETHARLTETIARNKLRDRVVTREWALARHDARRTMVDGHGISQSRGMLPVGAAGGRAVDAVSLDTLLDREGLRKVDLLKMDIEAGEHEVFAGASTEALRRIRRIALEYHPGGSKERLFERIREAGFEVLRDVDMNNGSGVAEFQIVEAE
jgi:FkbM family methyltransferase